MLIQTIAKLIKIQAGRERNTNPRLAQVAEAFADDVLDQFDDSVEDLVEDHPYDHPIFDDVDADTMEAFDNYHVSNPEIYDAFKELAVQTLNAGKRTYSAKSLMEVIRWNKSLVPGDTFKINNDYTSLFARLLIAEDERFSGFFELRQIKGLTSKTA